MKGKKESPGKELNEFEAINQSNTEFKIMVIRMLKEFRTTRNFMGATRNLLGTTEA